MKTFARTVILGSFVLLGCSLQDNAPKAGHGGSFGGGAGAGSSGTAGLGGFGGGASGAGGSTGAAGNSTGGAGNNSIDAAADRDWPDARLDAPLAQDSTDAKRDAAAPDASKPDGSAAYNPCPPKGTPCVILPVGDSITQGAPNPPAGGYRAPLFHLALAKGQTITFVGSGADGPAMVDGVAFPRAHEGHSGFNIDNTQGRMGVSQYFPERITTYKPNIVLLMIGTNDVDTGVTDAAVRLGVFMDTILNADPKLLLVVAKIVPQQTMMPDTLNMKIQDYNAAITGLVNTRVDAGKHVAMVDMYGAFVANPNFSMAYLADRLHPTAAGFGVMADVWYAAIGPFLR